MSARTVKLTIIKFSKDLLLASRLLQLLAPFNKVFSFLADFNRLTSWIHKHKKGLLVNDFYKPVRNYDDRLKCFEAIVDHYGLKDSPICYLEFGVASGNSFRWWLAHNDNPSSKFAGFDTFEGLPEDWGVFSKGDMSAAMPQVNDNRAQFVKGIFQDTLNTYLFENSESLQRMRKVIHMDADLFSSTLFALSQLYPYIRKGDIIMFDEFSVSNHEYKAFRYFTECFYVKLKLITAQNNYYQTAFEVV